MENTIGQYNHVIERCRDLFLKKAHDYGTSWRIMRLPSITDQIFIKAQRIRTIEEKGISKVGEGVEEEYIGIVNYCIIAQIQLGIGATESQVQDAESIQTGQFRETDLASDSKIDLSVDTVAAHYDRAVQETRELMTAKNHDYGEAWRDMRLGSLTDLILVKLHRTKQIEKNEGRTLVSEGVKANYQDMMNYAIFALIKLGTI